MKRPPGNGNEGKTPALSDYQAHALLDSPDPATHKCKRGCALLAVLLAHGLRREEPCLLKVRDIRGRRGVLRLRIHGKGNNLRYVLLHPTSAELIHTYLEVDGRDTAPDAPLFQPLCKTGTSITADGACKCVLAYAAWVTIAVDEFGVHTLRETAATNALEHEADIAKVQEWLGHANMATTRLYDRRRHRPEDSPTSKSVGDAISSLPIDANCCVDGK